MSSESGKHGSPSQNEVQRNSLRAVKRGFHVIPVCARSKKPARKNWLERAITKPTEARAYFDENPNANFGITTGAASGIVVIDVDGPEGEQSLHKLINKYGKLPKTVRVETPNGQHIYLQHPGGKVKNSAGKLATGIDVRGDGGYVVGAGCLHPSGGRYRYRLGRALGEVKIARMPSWLIELARARKEVPAKAPPPVPLLDPVPKALLARARAYVVRALEREGSKLSTAARGQRNDQLNRAAFRMGQFKPYGLVGERTIEAALLKAARASGLGDPEIRSTLKSGLEAGQRSPRPLPFPYAPKVCAETAKHTKKSSKRDSVTRDLARLGETDADNADRLVKRYSKKIRWTSGLGWLVSDGKRWVRDDHGKRLQLAIKVASAIKREAAFLSDTQHRIGREVFSSKSKNKSEIERMLELARPALAIQDDRLDRDPWLLNVANGTIDLKTGVLEKHDPRDLITKLANVDYAPDAKCKLFKRFLRKLTGGNKQLARFLQKAVGYSLTGLTTDQNFFFLYGPTKTAKSTFLNTIRTLLSDYGMHTPTETLIVKRFDNTIPADLARLKGARMVTAIEANQNQQLDEAKIKAMTGGDTTTARFMRQNFFEYVPEYKLWIASNYLPRVKVTDDALWERLVIIPCNEQVSAGNRDPFMKSKLLKEGSGILAWAVRGAMLWQKEGFADVSVIETAKASWREKADTVRRFVQECCRISGNDDAIQSSVLYARYKQWCETEGEAPCTIDMVKARLLELDVTFRREKTGSVWRGIKLID